MLVTVTSIRITDRRDAGFTIIQVVAAIAILGILSAVAVPGYQTFIERARQARAIAQIGEIEIAISEYSLANEGQLPPDLVTIDLGGVEDPWGAPVVYVDLALGGAPRVDQNGVAVNTDYDLYSSGSDGASALSLNADDSEDDIVRASDGGFVGVVSDYARLN
jgi:general secretion pathway protein G